MVFNSIFLEADNNSANQAANMVSNVSISYNAGDSTQRNAVLQAQTKISKAQKRKETADARKKKYGLTSNESAIYKDSMLEFTSIFY